MTGSNMMNPAALGAVIALTWTAANCLGQTQLRAVEYGLAHYKVEAGGAIEEVGSLRLRASSRTIEWFWSAPTSEDELTQDLPFPTFLPGGVAQVGPREFLVCGQAPTTGGVIAAIHCTVAPARSIVLDEVEVYPDLDVVRVAWNTHEQRLYLVDHVSRRIKFAPWAGPGNDLPAAAALSEVLLDDQALPALKDPLVHVIWSMEAEGGIKMSRPESVIGSHVYLDSGVWKRDFFSLVDTDPGTVGWGLRPNPYPATSGFEVSGPAGGFEIVRVDTGAVVGSGQIATAWSWVTFTPSPPLEPGGAYRLRGSDGTAGPLFNPLLRIGTPILADSVGAGPGQLPAESAVIGEVEFAVGCSVTFTPPPTSQLIVPAYLWIALRDAGAPAPVTWLVPNEQALLLPDASAEFQFFAEPAPDTAEGIAYPIGIPDNDQLVGKILYSQLLVEHPTSGDVTASDVFAVTIRDHPVALTSGGSVPAAVRARLERIASVWRVLNGGGALSAAARTDVERLVRQLRKQIGR